MGAAYAAGLAVGYWEGLDGLRKNWEEDKTWHPVMSPDIREKYIKEWKKAVERTFGWVN